MSRLLIKNLLIFGLGVVCVILLVHIVSRPAPVPVKRILVYQDKPQEWADALKLGFEAAVRDSDVGRNVTLVTKSAAADPQAATIVAQAVNTERYELIYTLGTQATQEIFRTVKRTPIVFGAVTDPVEAGFFDGSLQRPKGEITGTQDIWPYGAQFALMSSLVQNLRSVGILYNSSEVNSQVSLRLVKAECDKRGISLVERTVTDDSQVGPATASLLAAKVDAVYIPADNTAQANSQVIIAACLRAKKPAFTGITGIVERGALATVGTNYVELGRLNGRQAIEILNGRKARSIPVAVAEQGDLELNLATAERLGLSIPDAVRKTAVRTYR